MGMKRRDRLKGFIKTVFPFEIKPGDMFTDHHQTFVELCLAKSPRSGCGDNTITVLHHDDGARAGTVFKKSTASFQILKLISEINVR